LETLMAAEAGRVVIIGGGHNGLVAASYLAKAGLAPLVLERREIVGGAAVTEEIHPRFRCPTLAHVAGPLLPQIVGDLQLEKQGFESIRPDVSTLGIGTSGYVVRLYRDAQRTGAELSAISPRDGAKYPEFIATLQQLGQAIAPLLSMRPPDIDDLHVDDYFRLGKLGLKFRGLDKRNAYRLLRWAPMAVADLAAEWFETELLRAMIESRGIRGCFAGPRSAGTGVGLLLQAPLGFDTVLVRGAPGTLTQALAKSASAAGAQIRTGAKVVHIRVNDGRAESVVLESGEEIAASAVVSNADPQHTFLKLIDPSDLDPGFLLKVRAYRAVGTVAKINLALSGLPSFSGLKNGDLSGRIHIGPDTDYLERAYDDAKYGGFSTEPYMDITIPSVADPSLAPKGAHVMSIHVQYAPYRLKEGDWTTRRDDLGEVVLKTLSTYVPDIRELILERQILTPLAIEQTYGMTGGHVFHGEHALDQLFAFRPLLGWARYRTPIRNLYLCGAGTHPGGGITGAPGANASREIIKDMKSRRGK
jgi:phytoene dehydrogenase-like protein